MLAGARAAGLVVVPCLHCRGIGGFRLACCVCNFQLSFGFLSYVWLILFWGVVEIVGGPKKSRLRSQWCSGSAAFLETSEEEEEGVLGLAAVHSQTLFHLKGDREAAG